MITDRGTIKTETPITAEMQLEFVKVPYICAIVALIVGAVGVAAYLAWDISSLFVNIIEPSIWILLAVGILFAFGLVFTLSYKKMLKQTRTSPPKSTTFEFFSDHMVCEDYHNGEKMATVKVFYSQIVKRKETKNYLFFYVQVTAACPVGKSGLDENELLTVRKLLGFECGEGATVKLSAEPAAVTADTDEAAINTANTDEAAIKTADTGSSEATEVKPEGGD